MKMKVNFRHNYSSPQSSIKFFILRLFKQFTVALTDGLPLDSKINYRRIDSAAALKIIAPGRRKGQHPLKINSKFSSGLTSASVEANADQASLPACREINVVRIFLIQCA